MHPAPSVIVFTTLSGAGYGLLFLVGLFAAFGLLPAEPWIGAVGVGLALLLATCGLLSSMLHLGRPERAWRALSQWRTSWLSREGVAALLTYLPAGLLGLGWVIFGETGGAWAICGVLAAIGAGATTYCTAMIYASLKPVRRWASPWTPRLYAALGLMSGALWLQVLVQGFGLPGEEVPILSLAAIGLGWAVTLGYWQFVDTAPETLTAESATGLGRIGKVRLLEAPHTEENYLLKEMGFQVARKHAAKLRRLMLWAAFYVPALLTLLAWGFGGPLGTVVALLAALSAMGGVLVGRWLFFAEAKHAVMLYYGASRV